MNSNQHPGKEWIRTCQECGNKQRSNVPPVAEASYLRYADAKCTKCQSRSLDYGKWIDDEVTAKIKNEGYKAQAANKLLADNPYPDQVEPTKHWLWRAGWIEAFNDSN